MKYTAFFYIMLLFIGSLWAAGVCDSCGNECAPTCGTRRFRLCCHNYLKKRSDDKYLSPMSGDRKAEEMEKMKKPIIIIEEMEPWNFINELYQHEEY